MVLDHKDINEDQRERNGELAFVSALAFMLSMVAFVWFYRRGDILLWGDAVAHINIARRIVDARDPGWGQIGTVWLPLPHLLVAPFVANDWLWRTGVGGSIPSMFAYVLGVAGVYRLVRARAAAPPTLRHTWKRPKDRVRAQQPRNPVEPGLREPARARRSV